MAYFSKSTFNQAKWADIITSGEPAVKSYIRFRLCGENCYVLCVYGCRPYRIIVSASKGIAANC